MSRHVWIDQGAEPDIPKLEAHGITRCYFDARDTPPVGWDYPSKPGVMSGQRGIYAVQSWFPGIHAPAFASWLSKMVGDWGGDPYKQLAVHANIELHDPAYIVAFLKAWRAIRPYRETALVIEGLQGGWFSQPLRAWINGWPSKGVDVLAEAYYRDPNTGVDMQPYPPDLVRSDLENYGVSRARCLVMYDAARLDTRWDGCAFTQQRLP